MFFRKKRTTRAIVTLGSGVQSELLDITRATRKEYASRHGYEVVEDTRVLAPGRPPSWGKISLLRSLMETRKYDTIVWLDADTVIVDPQDDIGTELDCGRPIQFVSHYYDGHDFPNAGVLVLHRSPIVIEMLAKLWDATPFIDHRWWDNAAMLSLLGYKTEGVISKFESTIYDEYVGQLSLKWNSINQTMAEAPAIVHLAGWDNQLRVAVMKELVQKPERVVELLRFPQVILKEKS